MTTYRIRFEGPASLALGVATALADAEGVELTSSEPPSPIAGGDVGLDSPSRAPRSPSGRVDRIRDGLPPGSTIASRTVDPSRGVVSVLVLADTHLGPGRAGRLIERVHGELCGTDVVFHAGDITDLSVLDALADAPGVRVHAVEGNNDHRRALPERLVA